MRQLTSHQPPPTALSSTPSQVPHQTHLLLPPSSLLKPRPQPLASALHLLGPVLLKRGLPYTHPINLTSLLFPSHALYLLHSPAHSCFGANPPHCREPFGLLLFSYGIRCDSNEHNRKAVTRGNVRRLDFRSNDLESFHVLIILLCCSLSKLKLNLNLLNPTISM